MTGPRDACTYMKYPTRRASQVEDVREGARRGRPMVGESVGAWLATTGTCLTPAVGRVGVPVMVSLLIPAPEYGELAEGRDAGYGVAKDETRRFPRTSSRSPGWRRGA